MTKERIPLPKDRFAWLIGDIERSIDQFQRNAEGKGTFREAHDALRALWQRCDLEEPPIKVLREEIQKLPRTAIEQLGRRARVVILQLFDGESIEDDVSDSPDRLADRFLEWVASADDEKFVIALRNLSSEGERRVLGRSRGGGKRSRPRVEPVIMGVARGAGAHDLRGGAPTEDAVHDLVMLLAFDWLRATDKAPNSGRSDRTGFGDLVHSVIQWLNVSGDSSEVAAYALHRYWDAVKEQKERSAHFGVPVVCADCRWARPRASDDQLSCEKLSLECAMARDAGHECGPEGLLFEPG